jgi:hypothetical protein
MKLIREWTALCENGLCKDFLTEQEKREVSNGAVYLSGKFGVADEKNGNNRVYPKSVLEREVENYQKLIIENRALGELDHPDSDQINLKNACHVVTKLWWEGNTLYGKMKVLSTPAGKTLEALIRDGVQIGVSSRALGSLKESGNGPAIVGEDLLLIAFDCVSEPSAQGAFVKPVTISESLIRKISNNFTKSDRINRKLIEITNKL